MPARRTRRSLLLVAALALGALAAPAAARPGGGQSYSSPSRSSSSSSPSRSSPSFPSSPNRSSYRSRTNVAEWSTTDTSGGNAEPQGETGGIGSLITFVLIMLFILVVVVLLLRGQRRARAGVAVSAEAKSDALAALRREDPGFSEEELAARCLKMMTAINQAWTAGKMGPVRRYISDGVYVRFQAQLAMLAKQGVKNVMADAKAVSAEVAGAESDPLWDTVHVKVVGEARDADVPVSLSAAEAEKKARGASLNRYEEVWSFLRRRGKKSHPGRKTVLEGACANCGASLPSGEVVRCDHCKALTNSGEHDWVLAEITQPEEWSPASGTPAPIEGLDALRGRDPAVSRQELEDRASVAFWKWLEARATADRKRLDRFCVTPGHPDAPHKDLRQATIGSAELLRILPDPGDGKDRAEIEIRWSASFDGADPEGHISLVTLARTATATSKRGLSCLDCPHCGGPVADSDSPTCQYCKEPLSGPTQDWALLDVT